MHLVALAVLRDCVAKRANMQTFLISGRLQLDIWTYVQFLLGLCFLCWALAVIWSVVSYSELQIENNRPSLQAHLQSLLIARSFFCLEAANLACTKHHPVCCGLLNWCASQL